MKKAILTILIIVQLFILSCESNKTSSSNRPIYDIEILYRQTDRTKIRPSKSFNDKYLNDGKLYLHFESNFEGDTMVVKANGKFYKTLILQTDHGLGYSELVKFDKIEEIKNISLSLNNGNEAYFEINEINHITVDYGDTVLTIRYLENVPYYD